MINSVGEDKVDLDKALTDNGLPSRASQTNSFKEHLKAKAGGLLCPLSVQPEITSQGEPQSQS